MSTFDVRLSDNFMVDGLDVYISQRIDATSRLLLRLGSDAAGLTWERVDVHATVTPTLSLPGEAARALLDALLRHYEGASDMRTVRSDLLHERGRVDKLIDTISQIAASAG